MILTATTSLTLGIALKRIALSLLLGGMIGLERQLKFRSAGLRTFTLICLGSTLAMLLSIWIPNMTNDGFFHGDPARIAAQVLSGIGFLGAGAIIHHKGSIQGLTTAAGIWVSAIIGMAIGAGLYVPSIAMAVIVVVVLNVDEAMDVSTLFGGKTRYMELRFNNIQDHFQEIKNILTANSIRIIGVDNEMDLKNQSRLYVLHIRVRGSQSESHVLNELSAHPEILYISISN